MDGTGDALALQIHRAGITRHTRAGIAVPTFFDSPSNQQKQRHQPLASVYSNADKETGLSTGLSIQETGQLLYIV